MNASTDKITQLARIGTEFLAIPEEPAALRAIASKSTEFVPDCTAAAVAQMSRGGTLQVVASTDPAAAESERHQIALSEGPTATTFTSGKPNVADLRHEARWPTWVAIARGLELTALMTLMLTVGTERLGVLCLYSSSEGGFHGDAFAYANAYCSYAAVALFGARQASGLSSAVESRHRIGLAQGILMCRYSISKEAAFQLLRRYSNASNTKLREVAENVLEHGDLPSMHRPTGAGEPCGPDVTLVDQPGRRYQGPALRPPRQH